MNYKYQVVLIAPKQNQPLPNTLNNIRFYPVPFPVAKYPRHPKNFFWFIFSHIRAWLYLRQKKIKNFLAVDPMGLILAGRLTRFRKKSRITYISFEIFFRDESTQKHFLILKEKQKKYFQKVNNIIIQDNTRKQLLINENQISLSKIQFHLIPVSPALPEGIHKNQTKKNDEKITLIHSGTVDKWSGGDILINLLKKGLPQNFHLFIHSRFKLDPKHPIHKELFELRDKGYPLTLHDEVFSDYREYCKFLSSFNIGLAFYQPDYSNIYIGKNIAEIGLASGKFSTYMALGIPCITTPQSSFVNLNHQYNFGWQINNCSELIDVLTQIDLETLSDLSENCLNIYKHKLNPTPLVLEFLRSQIFFEQ